MNTGKSQYQKIERIIRNPKLALIDIYWKASIAVNRLFYRILSPTGDDFIEQDWDNLIILDACRFDWFTELNEIEGNLMSKISQGSESWVFMQENFVGKSLHDTVYVTANPWSTNIPDGTFHAIFHLHESHWSEEQQTVLPQDVIEQTIKIQEDFPNKRLISHFMQPHYPFIGGGISGIDIGGVFNDSNTSSDTVNPWTVLNHKGEYAEEVISSYKENHIVAIDSARRLVADLPGKTVVTADHANLVGELVFPLPKRMFGHPRGLRKHELITVPWLETEGDRRDVESEPPVSEIKPTNEERVHDRLRDLGYVPHK